MKCYIPIASLESLYEHFLFASGVPIYLFSIFDTSIKKNPMLFSNNNFSNISYYIPTLHITANTKINTVAYIMFIQHTKQTKIISEFVELTTGNCG